MEAPPSMMKMSGTRRRSSAPASATILSHQPNTLNATTLYPPMSALVTISPAARLQSILKSPFTF